MKVVVISGGTATNSLVPLFSSLCSELTYILPISDNGGSTSELMRVIGGPAIGDLRSRITRLISNSSPGTERGLYNLFTYRLRGDYEAAKHEWGQIVDGTHSLWSAIPSQVKELVRPFFVEVNGELLKRLRPGKEFRYEEASVGNLFLTGARIFCGSLDSAIELMLRISRVPNSINVLPAMNTNFSHHISALLQNGTTITGQSQISHPSALAPHADIDSESVTPQPQPQAQPQSTAASPAAHRRNSLDNMSPIDDEDAQLPFTHPDLKHSQLHFSKLSNEPLPSPIQRIHYINPYGHEIHPRASQRVISSICDASMVVYSIGSLYTSTIPIVILKGVSSALKVCQKKVFLLNGTPDRETGGMDAEAYVNAVISACEYSGSRYTSVKEQPFITHLVYLVNSAIPVQEHILHNNYGIKPLPVTPDPENPTRYDQNDLSRVLHQIAQS
ncbi:hypothetical protein TRICI_002322 [Trichomonascus ciferrii]|uniref:Uncharacterized protein n=1 Tax=Trichomonascus ciferrii TaxID=44093 RepID=A0A6A1LPS9_9ASCO|nr:hypothetical protein TRICI_002322 [Trichomonascus ciferrii]